MGDGGRYINEIADHPSFERIRSEILANVNDRALEARQTFTGLMTFCGVIYTGSTVAILSFIAARSSVGIPYLAVAAFCLFVLSIVAFAIFYQMHSQLIAARHYHYATTASKFFTRQATLEEMIVAGHAGQARYLYKLIFWVPLSLGILGYVCGGLGAVGVGPTVRRISATHLEIPPSSRATDSQVKEVIPPE